MSTARFPLPMIFPARLGTSAWLLQLRWIAVFGQLITIAVAAWLIQLDLPVFPLLTLVGLTAATNVAYNVWLWPAGLDAPARTERFDDDGRDSTVASALMLLDLGTLTAMLYFSGGATNPFCFFYFVNLAVGGVILRPAWAWGLAALAIAGYGFLIRHYYPVPILLPEDVDLFDPVRGTGRFVAFATCASVVTYFVTRTAGELTEQQKELQHAQQEHVRSRQLEGLTTLAAGAAHELATPLSTIDIIVRELGRHLEECQTPANVKNDLQLIDGQLDSCRQILSRMRAAAGDQSGQSWNYTTVGDLIDATLEGVRDPHRVDVVDGPEIVERQPLWMPQEAVAQAIRNLIHNGLDASGMDGRVRVEARLSDESVILEISDAGSGMSQEVLGRLGEPFFTTKEPGRGMGLGLFLARNVISKLGGHLDFRPADQQGTVATVKLPRAPESAEMDGNHVW